MSLEAYTAVWADKRKLAPGPKMVLLALADFAWPTGWAFPSIETIANKAGLSMRHCMRLVEWLEDNEFLMVLPNQGWNGTHLYGICSVCQGKFEPPRPDEIAMAMRTKKAPKNHAKKLTPPDRMSPPLTSCQGDKRPPEMSPEPEGTFTPPPVHAQVDAQTAGPCVEFPAEESVLREAKAYQGNLAKGVPAVIPETWAKNYWGWRTFRLRQWIPAWESEMVWRFEKDWQDGQKDTRHLQKKEKIAPTFSGANELTFESMRAAQ